MRGKNCRIWERKSAEFLGEEDEEASLVVNPLELQVTRWGSLMMPLGQDPSQGATWKPKSQETLAL